DPPGGLLDERLGVLVLVDLPGRLLLGLLLDSEEGQTNRFDGRDRAGWWLPRLFEFVLPLVPPGVGGDVRPLLGVGQDGVALLSELLTGDVVDLSPVDLPPELAGRHPGHLVTAGHVEHSSGSGRQLHYTRPAVACIR